MRGVFRKLAEALRTKSGGRKRRSGEPEIVMRSRGPTKTVIWPSAELSGRGWSVGTGFRERGSRRDPERRLATQNETMALRTQLDELTWGIPKICAGRLREVPMPEEQMPTKQQQMTPVEWMVQDTSAQLEQTARLVGSKSPCDGQIDPAFPCPPFLHEPEDSRGADIC